MAGHDAGSQSIAHHLAGGLQPVPSLTTVWRILKRQGLITPEPHKRPPLLLHPLPGPGGDPR